MLDERGNTLWMQHNNVFLAYDPLKGEVREESLRRTFPAEGNARSRAFFLEPALEPQEVHKGRIRELLPKFWAYGQVKHPEYVPERQCRNARFSDCRVSSAGPRSSANAAAGIGRANTYPYLFSESY